MKIFLLPVDHVLNRPNPLLTDAIFSDPSDNFCLATADWWRAGTSIQQFIDEGPEWNQNLKNALNLYLKNDFTGNSCVIIPLRLLADSSNIAEPHSKKKNDLFIDHLNNSFDGQLGVLSPGLSLKTHGNWHKDFQKTLVSKFKLQQSALQKTLSTHSLKPTEYIINLSKFDIYHVSQNMIIDKFLERCKSDLREIGLSIKSLHKLSEDLTKIEFEDPQKVLDALETTPQAIYTYLPLLAMNKARTFR